MSVFPSLGDMPNPVGDEVERIKRIFAGGDADRAARAYAQAVVGLRHHARGLVHAHRHGNGLQGWYDLIDNLERAIEESIECN